MDLLVVILLLLKQFCLLASFTYQDSQATQFSTTRYSYSKYSKEEAKYRRQFPRKLETISLKPPPKDWPEPVVGAADFIVLNKKLELTSLSPLDIYQAKLEKEFIKQQEQNENRLKEETKEESPIWTSSEEDMKRLLDPGELLKHNKQLKPIVNEKLKLKDSGKIKSASKQGYDNLKPGSVKSSATLKVKKTKIKSKSAALKVTTKPSRRGRKKKTNIQDVYAEVLTTPKELKKFEEATKKDPEKLSVKTKRPKKKARVFTFATNYFQEGNNESITYKSTPSKNRNYKSTLPEEVTTTTTTSKTIQIKKKAQIPVKSIGSENITSKNMKIPDQDCTTTNNNTYEPTTESITTIGMIFITNSDSIHSTSKPTLITQVTTTNKRQEIKKKREQLRQDMKNIVVEEQLEGSFSDSNWTFSQERKIPIIDVTPQPALLEIIKHKVMSLVEQIIGESKNLPED